MSAFRRAAAERLRSFGVAEGVDDAAAYLEDEALRYVRALVPDGRLHGPVMDSPELADGWPLHAGLLSTNHSARSAIVAAFKREPPEFHVGPMWHPDVTRNEIAEALERLRDDEAAAWFAARLRAGVVLAYSVSVIWDGGFIITPTIFRSDAFGGMAGADHFVTSLELAAGRIEAGEPRKPPADEPPGGMWLGLASMPR